MPKKFQIDRSTADALDLKTLIASGGLLIISSDYAAF